MPTCSPTGSRSSSSSRSTGRNGRVCRRNRGRVTIDVGQENVEHTFEITAWSAGDVIGSETRRTPAIRVDEALSLELRQLYVTVTDRSGERVTGLSAGDFEVRDNQIKQTLVTFEGGDAPLSAALLVDASISMRREPTRSRQPGCPEVSERSQTARRSDGHPLLGSRALAHRMGSPWRNLRGCSGKLPSDRSRAAHRECRRNRNCPQ